MRVTAGLLIRCNDCVLLVKQKGTGKYSIPKGEVQEEESHLDAAIRETEEECGIRVSPSVIDNKEYLCSIDSNNCQRKLFYFEAGITEEDLSGINCVDSSEIEEVIICGIEEAISRIQTSQVAILWDGGNVVNRRILDRMVDAGWIQVEKHPSEELFIYDYTDKCKKEKAWSELTMWCRGLIINGDGKIIAYPLKKFFEYNQLFPECRSFDDQFEVSEKMDGFLGISYYIDGNPYIATRSSFISAPAIKATMLLYSKHLDAVAQMNREFTYIFEIIYPNDYLVLNYGELEDIFLIDIVDSNTGKSVVRDAPTMSFRVIRHEKNTHGLSYYLRQNRRFHEGLVLKFDNGDRLKVKYPWYKNKYNEKNE